MIPLDLPALTERSEAVVSGTVTQTVPRWTPDHGAIHTDVTLHITRVLTGSYGVGEDIVIRREGGSLDGVGMKIFGAPSFSKGDEVAVFLEHRGAHLYVVGMAQGKLDLVIDGTKRLERDLSEVSYTRSPTPTEQTLSSSPTGKTASAPARIDTLTQLETEVRRLVAARKKLGK